MRFKFGRILRYKEQIEEKKKIELKNELDTLENFKRNKEKLENQLMQYSNVLKSNFIAGIDASVINNYYQWINFLKRQINVQEGLIYYQTQKVDAKRQEVIEAMIDKKKYEELKEKFLINQYQEERKFERKELDVVVSFRQYKKLGES